MFRLTISTAIACLALGGWALADDEVWDWDSVEGLPPASPAQASTNTGPVGHDSHGHYFGSGDEFISGQAGANAFTPFGAFNSGQAGNFQNDNVYGPLWGVPDDAVGLEGYVTTPIPQGFVPYEVPGGPAFQGNPGSAPAVGYSGHNHTINHDDPNDW
ncbi:hypothetical protein IIA79_08415 [bacterium]|nr:hypothetical protein [bacterium]